MALHNELGKEGEAIAREYLLRFQYDILETNYTFQKGEIDIIAQKDDEIIFFEVKTRQSREMMTTQESVTKRKQKLIIKTAHQYLTENEIELEARFDIIGIVLNKYESDIEHIEGAFYPTI